MSRPWYLVVADGVLRSAGKRAFEQEGKRYLGVGGVAWPLDDEALGDSARILNRQLMDGRERIELSNGTWQALCLDIERAREYYLVAAKGALEAQRYDQPDAAKASVRMLCLREDATTLRSGYDFGQADGGYSIIESELMMERDAKALAAHFLNDCGLFRSLEHLRGYLDLRSSFEQPERLEEIGAYLVVNVEILQS